LPSTSGASARTAGSRGPADANDRLGGAVLPYPTFTDAPQKTYQLAAIVRGRTPAVGRGPERSVPAMPHLFYAELGVFMLTILLCVALSLVSDAPLKELANPAVPENPAKAPWYFLGLQELVSYSAFMGGIGIPTIVILGLTLIPYLDRESEGTGEWFGGPGGLPLVLRSVVVGLGAVLAVEVFAVRCGWIREWWLGAPQILITFLNPGTLLTFAYGAYSVWCVRRYDSTRAGALGLFTCFLCGFLVLTIVGTHFRGPNWGFYWSPADWPKH
jgi:quinol-cytochrome oxidoreductase complex cytochrome b subunit